MALPPELQEELKQVADLPLASALEREMEGHVNLAAAKAQGSKVGMSNLFNSVMIASEQLNDAERLAKVYAKSLVSNRLVQEDKVTVLDWKSLFNNAAKSDSHIAIADNLSQAFRDAEGGVLIISEPYQPPADMSPRDFAFANYTATALLMEKMDEMEDSFNNTFDDLYARGKNLSEIDRQISNKDFENPRKPVVVMIGKPFEMESMLADDPYPWNMRFMHRIGIRDSAADGVKPSHKPAPKKPAL